MLGTGLISTSGLALTAERARGRREAGWPGGERGVLRVGNRRDAELSRRPPTDLAGPINAVWNRCRTTVLDYAAVGQCGYMPGSPTRTHTLTRTRLSNPEINRRFPPQEHKAAAGSRPLECTAIARTGCYYSMRIM